MKRTLEEAAVDYVIAVAEIRRLTKIMGNGECSIVSEAVLAGKSGSPATDSCVKQCWSIHLERDHNGEGREVPDLDYEEACERCKGVMDAFHERREWRAKLGAIKRVIEAHGKRLRKQYAS
jgi:hypothetical protein